MTVEQAIWHRIKNLPAVTLITPRHYVLKLPQSPTYPATLTHLIDDPRPQHLRGPLGAPEARVQVDVFTKEASGYDARAVSLALAAAVDGDGLGEQATGIAGFIGTIPTTPPLQILRVERVNCFDRFDPDELNVLTRTLDYLVRYRAN